MQKTTRRRLMRVLACCGAAALGLDALVIEPRWLAITRHDVPIAQLPSALEGFTIAHLSDLHLSSLGTLEEQVVAAIREASPQLLMVTGDAVEKTEKLTVLSELLAALRGAANARVIATMGNWEHWGGVSFEAIHRTYADAGSMLLGNESLLLDGAIAIVATDDHCSGADDLERALKNAPLAGVGPRLLVTHAPGLFDRAPPGSPKFDQCFAGHTHGGQVRPGLTLWTPPGSGHYVAGSYETPCGPAYVSKGIGTSVLAARLGCRPELPIFRLVRA